MRELAQILMYDPTKIEVELLQDMARFRARPGATPFILELRRYGVTPFGQRQRILRSNQLRELACPPSWPGAAKIVYFRLGRRCEPSGRPCLAPNWKSSTTAAIGQNSKTPSRSLAL